MQVTGSVVDVLFVLDTSGSMRTHFEAMAEAYPRFAQPFVDSEADFHMGVTTTDMTWRGLQGRLREADRLRWVDNDTPDLVNTFRRLALVDRQEHTERGLDAIHAALGEHTEPEGFNEGFRRRLGRAWLHVTVISNEDDHSSDEGIGGITLDDFLDFMEEIKPNTDRLTFNSIVSLKTGGADYSQRGWRYIAATEELGGSVLSLHDDEWPDIMETLGGVQAPGPQREFFLSRLPVEDTITVQATSVDGITFVYLRGQDFEYQEGRNSILFTGELIPPIGAEVEITYDVLASSTRGAGRDGPPATE